MSPSLEKARSLDYEVLFMTEPLDELCAQAIETYDSKKLVDLSKENADIGEKEEDKKEKVSQLQTRVMAYYMCSIRVTLLLSDLGVATMVLLAQN